MNLGPIIFALGPLGLFDPVPAPGQTKQEARVQWMRYLSLYPQPQGSPMANLNNAVIAEAALPEIPDAIAQLRLAVNRASSQLAELEQRAVPVRRALPPAAVTNETQSRRVYDSPVAQQVQQLSDEVQSLAQQIEDICDSLAV